MYAPGHITREDESKFPKFNSHAEAHEWFKDKYGHNFQFTGTEVIDGQNCYFYYLILDKDTFWKGQKSLAEKGDTIDALRYLGSHQSIEIFADGSIYIVH